MKKEDILRKLTSRKLWAAVASVIIAVCVIVGVDEMRTEQIVGLVTAVGALIAYIFGEGLVDAARLQNESDKEKMREIVSETVDEVMGKL